ncbi:MAG: SLC13 family permease [Pirellulaceae bacterium]|nr:SLC13 family permease [Pirellulaceae bacterium]
MTFSLAVVLLLLAAAIVMFAIDRPRMDAVALIVLTVLPFTGVVTMSEALAGFADGNIVLVAALFVIGDGLVRTGVARRLGDWLIARAKGNDLLLLVLLMVVVCGLGATMSSTAVTAIFIPVALRISTSTGTPASRLMMPISMAALISGMTTLVATAPNLVVNSELERAKVAGFGFFSFTPFGLPILILGILYMTFARRWLAGDDAKAKPASRRPNLQDWVDSYQLAGREHRVLVTAESPLVGQTVSEIGAHDQSGATAVAIERGTALLQPDAKMLIQAGDVLLIDHSAPPEEVADLRRHYGLIGLPLAGAYFTDRSQEIGMAEAIVPAMSDLVGRSVVAAEFRSRFGLTAIGLIRGGQPHAGSLRNVNIKLGDSLLLIGPWEKIEDLRSAAPDLALLRLPAEMDDVLPAPGKAIQAVACLLLVVGLMVSGLVPNVQAALIGCLLMGALGVVNPTSAYRAIDWKTIVLIVGMLPFSIALQRTGGVDLAAEALMTITQGAGPRVILAALFVITALLGMFISNTATAVLMAPVALAVAKDLGFSPYPFAMTVALAASTAFMTPVSSPVNTLVVTPGNYTFGDFIKVGVPFSLLVLVVCVILVPWLLPL